MKESWISEQSIQAVSQWDNVMETHYPQSQEWVNDANEYVKHLCVECNYLDSVKMINWDEVIPGNSTILDLACGGGWLSCFLSSFKNIKKIYSVDSSVHFIKDILPEVFKIQKGNVDIVVPIQGIFYPLLLEDSSIDVVVASSALHHADNLEIVLLEIKRVLKSRGYLVIVNETPDSYVNYLYSITKVFIKIFLNTISKKYISSSQSISSNGFLNNPILGDRSYPLWFWVKALEKS